MTETKENYCKPPNGQLMCECTVAEVYADQEKCKYFDKASYHTRCFYIVKFDDFYHCGCCAAQMEVK